jgi:hypothetical protein
MLPHAPAEGEGICDHNNCVTRWDSGKKRESEHTGRVGPEGTCACENGRTWRDRNSAILGEQACAPGLQIFRERLYA